jgi:hypothetical protein
MSGKLHKPGWSYAAVILMTLTGAPGCLMSRDALHSLPPACQEACASVPCACRSKVYVFLINGFDPLGLQGGGEVRATLVRAGFTKVYDGQFYHGDWFAGEMRRLHAEQPDVRFALVGLGGGAEVAARLAQVVAADGIVIDLLASVDAPFWSAAPGKHPDNVKDVLCIHGQALIAPVTQGAGMDVELPVYFWEGVPRQPQTLERLANQLVQIAEAVPITSVSMAPPETDDIPTPRPVAARTDGPRDEWDFLKPVARLGPPAPKAAEPPAEPTLEGERTALR